MKRLLKLMTHCLLAAIISGLATAAADPLAAQQKYGPGVNGRKIRFISYDDGFSPPKTFEQARKLVEDDEVLLIFQSLGTPTNAAIQKYMNQKKVPQLFVATGATRFGDWKNFPWTMGWQPTCQIEGNIYAKYLLENQPTGRLGVLYQNDDSGKDYLKGIEDGLGGKMQIVAELSYEAADATVDSQIVSLKAAGAAIFLPRHRRNSPRRQSSRHQESPGSRYFCSPVFRPRSARF